ncbi:GNAT family N-acetyltransferase [Shewanella avicenniae]|uniref:GNAT family N-acetyltransferase n=1 Tax=Shewanella avicenniae TaxID=2814294 RepID=A0ABX7QSU6_9GAMM|nr:GNAT family N-acetyltransferase [Shewanella avicenniae]QSX34494.1 GNAT family N-acetyltransferase [Shewanella avicenniae]
MLLQTERFTLRPLAEQDATLFQSLYCDKELMRHIGPALSEHDAIAAFNTTLKTMYRKAPYCFFWVIEQLEQALGVVGIADIKAKQQAEIGIILLRRAHRKRVADEVVPRVIRYCSEQLELKQLVGTFDSQNLAALRLNKRMGFSNFRAIEGKAQQLQGYLTLNLFKECQ